MRQAIVVQADWDDWGKVWIAGSPHVEELAVEAPTLEELRDKIYGVILDLVEQEGNPSHLSEIPISIRAEHFGRVTIPCG
jgi:hypothetical protein